MDQDLGRLYADAFWQAVGGWVAAALEWAGAHPWQTGLIVVGAIALVAFSARPRRHWRS